uniref:Thaumatin-like protein-2 n=1 Tax=Bursaphelenchus xylophilus TaxID=6326 RepID=A0A4P8D338_BURXY|nr:thaumatin-like protein-2 [Bursaphelenchus xylophilus]
MSCEAYTLLALGLTLAEFSFENGDGNDYYDLSVIVGFDVGMTLRSSDGTNLRCYERGCPDAYQYPGDNSKTHGVRTGGTFDLYFC